MTVDRYTNKEKPFPQAAQVQPPAEKPVAWWNGISEDKTERSPYGPSIRWGADAENSGHDIPMYAGYNPVHFAHPAADALGVVRELVAKWRTDADGWYGDDFNRGRQAATIRLADELEAALAQAPASGEAVARDREADRVRFADAAFNNWLDEGISDSGHTVWDAVGDVSTAWSAWCAREFYGMPPVADCVAPEEIYIRDGAGRYVLCDLQETTFDDLPLYCARTQVLYTTPPAPVPAVRVDDALLRVSDEDLRWCKDTIAALQEAGGPTNNMRAVGLSRLIAALEAALGQENGS